MIKLKPIADITLVRLYVSIPLDIKQMLDAYADVYEKTYGARKPIEVLIPHMLHQFLQSDHEFKKIHSKKNTQGKTKRTTSVKATEARSSAPENKPDSQNEVIYDYPEHKEEKPPPSQGLLTPGFVFGPKS